MKSVESMAPVTSIRPATTAIAPPIALTAVSTTEGRFTRIDATHTMAPTRTPTTTATQLQSIPSATTSPAPTAKPTEVIAMTTAKAK